MAQLDGADNFFSDTAPLAAIVRGYELLRQWEDDGEVCSIYNFKIETPAGAGSVLMAEWNEVSDGKLTSAKLVFDTAAFMALMPQQ